MKPRFLCPACGFAVFNRRAAACERCGAHLPADFAYSAGDLSRIDAEHARNEQVRADLARDAAAQQARRRALTGDSGIGDVLDAFDGGGDGGGGD